MMQCLHKYPVQLIACRRLVLILMGLLMHWMGVWRGPVSHQPGTSGASRLERDDMISRHRAASEDGRGLLAGLPSCPLSLPMVPIASSESWLCPFSAGAGQASWVRKSKDLRLHWC
jgi:hypothetical protein